MNGIVLAESTSVTHVTLDKPRSGPQKHESRKTRYTRQALREAFIELLQEQPIEKITVTRICELADVSRGTFYLYYHDPFDLLDCLEDEFLAELERQLMAKLAASTGNYSEDTSFWLDLLSALFKARDLTYLFFTNRNSSFITKCLALNRPYAEELCKREFPSMTQRERNYSHTFYEYGSFSVISLWVQEGFREPPVQVAALLATLNLCRTLHCEEGRSAIT